MPLECWPSEEFCLKHVPPGIHGVNTRNKQGAAKGTPFGAQLIHQSRKGGKALEQAGKAQVAMSYTSYPERKLWTQYTRPQLRAARHRTGAGRIDKPVRAYDPKPRRDNRRIQAHASRRPLLPAHGRYSRTSKSAVKSHQRKIRLKGSGKIAAGRMLPFLGYGIYGYDVLRTGDPLGEIARDIAWAKSNPGKAAWRMSGGEDTMALINYRAASRAAAATAARGTASSGLSVWPTLFSA